MTTLSEVETLLGDLVAIDSTNPDLAPGAVGEADLARFVAGWLEQAGLEVHLDEVRPGRPNVIGLARGTGGGRTLLLNGHLDTVSAGGMPLPHRPHVEDGRLYGRGAYDMKGGLAACMLAAAAARRLALRGDVVVTGVMDEEYAGLGSLDVARRYQADGAIVAESTELQLIVAHKGFVWLEVETQGMAAHGSLPDLGVDAIAKMGPVLTAVEQLGRELNARPPHPRLGHGSLHASLIQGGLEPSTYPDRCRLTLERRTLPGESPAAVEAELQGMLNRLSRADPAFKATVRRTLDRAPLETPESAAIVPALSAAAAEVLGRRPELAGVPYWTDAASLWAAGIPSVVFGPTGTGAHADEEWVDLESVRACAEIFREAAREFCAGEKT
jgi:acetylornithine deacetylase